MTYNTFAVYVSLQEHLDDQTIIDELIEEFTALNKARRSTGHIRSEADTTTQRLQGFSFSQVDDFAALRRHFEDLGRQIEATYNNRSNGLRGEYQRTQAEISKLEQDLKTYVSLSTAS